MPEDFAVAETEDLTAADPFYITGGTLPLDADSYVVRRADAQLFDGLRRSEFCYVLNTRQMGKSSLMVRAARRLREDGCQVALLDLTAVGQNLTVDQWYYGLLTRTAAQTGKTAAMLAFWKTNRELGPMQRYLEAIRYVLLEPGSEEPAVFPTVSTIPPAPPLPPRSGNAPESASRAGDCDRLIIFVDEIDVVRSLPFSADEFFAGIRECYNRRPQDPVFERLTFCLLGVAAPSDLVQDTRISPFNIGTRIELEDFTPEEAVRLARGLLPNRGIDDHALLAQAARRLLGRVLYWTSGHPYMTQRLCQAVAQNNSGLGAAFFLIVDPRVDRLCRELFLTKRALEADDNLTFVRNRLLHSETDVSALLDLYRVARRRRIGIDNDAANPLCSILQLAGIVAASHEHHERLVCRNRIYDRVFDDVWIDEHLPGAELRRQRAAFRRGVWRTALVGGSVSLGFLALATFAVNRAAVARHASELATTASKRAAESEATSRARLSRAYVEQGRRLMDAGDASGALAPLAEAMRLDSDDPSRTAQHRLRLGTALALCPRLDRLWSVDTPLKWATFSPDKNQIAAVGEDGHVYLWNANTATDAATAERPDEIPTTPAADGTRAPINFAAFSPDGARFVTCHDDACARVWDVRPGERRLLYTLPQAAQNDGNRRVLTASWSGDGRHLVLVGGAHSEVWELPRVSGSDTADRSAELPRRIEQDDSKNEKVAAVAFSPTGSQFAITAHLPFSGWQIGVPDKSIAGLIATKKQGVCYVAEHVAYNRNGTRLLVAGEFTTHPSNPIMTRGACLLDTRIPIKGVDPQRSPLMPTGGSPLYAAFSPDETRIATASADGTAQIWDAATGKPLTPRMRHASGVTQVEFSPDGTRVVTASMDSTVRVWDAATGEPICAPLHHAGAVLTAQFGTDRDHLLTASRDGSVRLWSLPPTHSLFDAAQRIPGFTVPVPDLTLAYHQDERRQQPGHVIDLATGKTLFPPSAGPTVGDLAGWTSGNRHLLIGAAPPGSVPGKSPKLNFVAWDDRERRPVTPFLRADAACLSHRRDLLMLVDWMGERKGIYLLRIGRDRQMTSLLERPDLDVPHSGFQTLSPFSPDDHAFLGVDTTGPTRNSARLYSTENGTPLSAPMALDGLLKNWAFTPNGRYLFTWSDESEILQIWNACDGTPAAAPSPLTEGWVDRFSGGDSDDAGLRFSADSSMAVTRSESDIRFWRLSGTKLLPPQRISLPQTKCAVFSPNGKWFAAIGQSQWLWNTRSSQAVPVRLSLESGLKVVRADFSSDSRRVLAVSEDGTTTIYDTQTSQPVTQPLPFPNTTYAAFSPDGTMAATGNEQGQVRVWDAATGEPLTPLWQTPRDITTAPQKITSLHFTSDQKRLITSTGSNTCLWNLQWTCLPPALIRAQSTLLSSQQMDPQRGAVLASPEATRAAWEAVQSTYGTAKPQ